jgi:hypothetical protein
MSVDQGTIRISLIANTASFDGPIGKSGQNAKNTARSIQESFNGIDLHESRGSLMLIDEMLGIHLPRHATAFAATLPGIQTALAAAFPLAAVAAIAMGLFHATEAAQKHREELEKQKKDLDDATEALTKHTASLEADRLKLADHIAVLEGRPTQNKVKEALEQAKAAAVNLNKELGDSITKITELLEKQSVGSWHSAITGAPQTDERTEQAKSKLADLETAQKAFNKAATDGAPDAALSQLRDKVDTAAAAVRTLAKEWDAATTKKTRFEAQTFQQNIHNEAPDPRFLAAREKDHAAERSAQQALFSVADNVQKQITDSFITHGQRRTEAALQELHDNIDYQDKLFAESKKVVDAQTKEQIASYELQLQQGKITAGQLAALQQNALDKQFNAELAHLQKIKALEAGHPALVAQTNKQIEALQATHDTQIISAYASTLNKQKELTKTFEENLFKENEARNTKEGNEQVALAMKSIHEMIASRIALHQLTVTPLVSQKEIDSILAGASAYDKFNKEQEVAVRLQQFAKANKGLGMADYTAAETAIRKQVDLEDELAAAQKVASSNHLAAIDREIAALEKLRSVAQSQGKSTLAIDAQLHQDQLQREQDIAAQLVATAKLGNVFKGTLLQMAQEGKQWQVGLANTFKQGVASMNNNLAQLATTGKADFRSMAQSMIGDTIKVALQYVESKLFMAATDNSFFASALAALGIHTDAQITGNVAEAQSSTATAAANTLADVPFPGNIPAAASVMAAGEAFVADAAASRGALLPNREMNVRTHPEEMILPRNISSFIVKSVGSQSGNAQSQPSHLVFAPTIHAVDAEGMDRILERHGDRFFKKAQSQLRSQNMV